MHILINDFIGGALDRGIPLYVRNLIDGLQQEGFDVAVVRAPAWCRKRMGCLRRSHELKSPTTATRVAFGAQTAKRTPLTPSTVAFCAPKVLPSSKWRPSLNRKRSMSPSRSPNE